MLRFDWDGLRMGDHVLVHASSGSEMELSQGIVVMVDVRKGSNGIGVRMTTDGQAILWPSRLAVHVDPCDPTESCWRCQALSDAGELRSASASGG